MGFSQFVLGAPLQYLTRYVVTETAMENPTANNWNAGDDSSVRVNIGFDFPFNGTTYDQVWINSNGMLSFSSSNRAYGNGRLAYTAEPQSIYPYWDDLNRRAGGTIRYETYGSAPNRHFVIGWKDVPHYPRTGAYSFEVVLYENSDIRFRYKSDSSVDGNSATIGVQEDRSHYDQYSFNSPIDNTKDVLYTSGKPKMSISKTSLVISDPVNNTSKPKRIPGSIVRYCFTVDNNGTGDSGDSVIQDSLTGNGKDNLKYIKSGYVLQDISSPCNCESITDVSGTISGTDVSIPIGSIKGSSDIAHSRGCAYIEVEIK